MNTIDRNIVTQLYSRERGFRTRRNGASMSNEQSFRRHATELAELVLLHRLKTEDLCKPIDAMPDATESVCNIEQSADGLITTAIDTQGNVNVFQTTSMFPVGTVSSSDQHVLCLAFHPANANLIALSTISGMVSVYATDCLVASYRGSKPVQSLCFHATQNFLLLGQVEYKIIFWDWTTNITHISDLHVGSNCVYMRMLSDNRLITGIMQSERRHVARKGENMENTPSDRFVMPLLHNIDVILDRLLETLTTEVGNVLHTEMTRSSLICVYLMQTIDRKKINIRYVEQIEDTHYCTPLNLNYSLNPLKMKLDALEQIFIARSIVPLDLSPKLYWSSRTVLYSKPKAFFEEMREKYIFQQSVNIYIRYCFDLNLVQEVLEKLFNIVYCFVPYILPTPEKLASMISWMFDIPVNHALVQTWNVDWEERSSKNLPNFMEDWKNVITTCIIHKDSNVAISPCEQFVAIVRFEMFNTMEIFSLRRESFGESLFKYNFSADFISLSFSPSGRFVAIGIRCRRSLKYAYIVDKESHWRIGVASGAFDEINYQSDDTMSERVGLKLSIPQDSQNYLEINCIKWATLPGHGLLLGLKEKFIRACR